MSWDYHWIPILCGAILTGREGRNSIHCGLAAISESICALEQARLSRHEGWLHLHRSRREVMTFRSKVEDASKTQLDALREAAECLKRYSDGGGLEFIYRARSRVQLSELSERRYTSQWFQLTYPDLGRTA